MIRLCVCCTVHKKKKITATDSKKKAHFFSWKGGDDIGSIFEIYTAEYHTTTPMQNKERITTKKEKIQELSLCADMGPIKMSEL